jgi:ketosteroid isomerase-like protein
MPHPDTAEVINRFNDAFVQRDPDTLVDLVGDDCVMESAQPAPNGARYEGYDACLHFWRELIADPEGSVVPARGCRRVRRPGNDPLALPLR